MKKRIPKRYTHVTRDQNTIKVNEVSWCLVGTSIQQSSGNTTNDFGKLYIRMSDLIFPIYK